MYALLYAHIPASDIPVHFINPPGLLAPSVSSSQPFTLAVIRLAVTHDWVDSWCLALSPPIHPLSTILPPSHAFVANRSALCLPPRSMQLTLFPTSLKPWTYLVLVKSPVSRPCMSHRPTHSSHSTASNGRGFSLSYATSTLRTSNRSTTKQEGSLPLHGIRI